MQLVYWYWTYSINENILCNKFTTLNTFDVL